MARYSRNDQAGVELPKTRLDRETLRQTTELFHYLRPYRARFIAALGALFVSSLLMLAFPYLAGTIIDQAMAHTPGAGLGGIDQIALLLIGILAVQAAFLYFHASSCASVGQRAVVDLRRDTFFPDRKSRWPAQAAPANRPSSPCCSVCTILPQAAF